MSVEGDGFTMLPDTSFTPRVTSPNYKTIRIDNAGHLGKHLSAEMTADTRCSKCGNRFGEGDYVIAHLSELPGDAVWEHRTCP